MSGVIKALFAHTARRSTMEICLRSRSAHKSSPKGNDLACEIQVINKNFCLCLVVYALGKIIIIMNFQSDGGK